MDLRALCCTARIRPKKRAHGRNEFKHTSPLPGHEETDANPFRYVFGMFGRAEAYEREQLLKQTSIAHALAEPVPLVNRLAAGSGAEARRASCPKISPGSRNLHLDEP